MWPTFTEGPWWPQTLQLMPWVAAFGLCAAIALWMARVGRIRLPFWGAAVTILGGYAIGACLVSVRAPEDRARVVRAGKLAVMERFDPTSTRGVAIAGMNRLTDNETLAATTVSEQRSQSIDGAATRRSDWRFALPAGRYDVRVWLDRSEAREGDVTVELGRGVEIAHASASAADPVVLSAELVVSGPIELTSPVAAVQRAIRRVDVTPAAIVPASVRPPFTARSVEPLAESGQAYLAYVDDNTYPEGGTFWTKSTNRGTVVVARAGRTAMRLVLHVGPGGGAVDVDAGSWHWRGDFEPNATRELDVPLPAGDVVPLSVRASRAFVPARVDSGSADWRRLGCQVRVLLQ
jgi:hypothetical protein